MCARRDYPKHEISWDRSSASRDLGRLYIPPLISDGPAGRTDGCLSADWRTGSPWWLPVVDRMNKNVGWILIHDASDYY